MSDAISTPVAGFDATPAPAPAATAQPEAIEVDPFLAFEDKGLREAEDDAPAEAIPEMEAEPEAEPVPEPPDTKKYEVESADGTKKKMTVAEMQKAIKASGMFQADHTRKTQELAEGRKALSREVVALKAAQHKHEQSVESVREFFGAIAKPDADPYYVMRMLEGQGIPIRNAVTRLVEDVLREQNMPEAERMQRDHARRVRAAQKEQEFHESKVATARKLAEEQQRTQRQSVMEKRMTDWSQKALTESGLPVDAYARERLTAALREIAAKERRVLTYDDFKDAAATAKKTMMAPLSSFAEDDLVSNMDEAAQRKLALALQKHMKRNPQQAQQAPSRAAKPPTAAPTSHGYKKPTLAERIRNGG